MSEHRVGPAEDLPPGKVVGVDKYAVGNNVHNNASGAEGAYFAVTRRCRHLRADLAGGSIDDNGCLVCPWHQSAYDVSSGQMVRGPQGIYAKIPGLGWSFQMLTRVLPLGRGRVTRRGDDLFVE